MKKLFFTIFCILIGIYDSVGQTIGYTYKPLATEGCGVIYNVVKQNDKYYVIVTVESDRMKFLSEATMMLKTFNNNVITLNGSLIDTTTDSGAGFVVGNMIFPVTSINSTAQFEIIEEQIEFFNEGISKIRLSTIPIEHERTFKKDKIGRKLYQQYKVVKNKDATF